MSIAASPQPPDAVQARASRHDRPFLVGYLTDAATETAIRGGLLDSVGRDMDMRRGGIKSAIQTLRRQGTPQALIIDIDGEKQPISALSELAQLIEPDATVLLVGSTDNTDFYREVTHGMGAAEYLAKPLTREKIARHFAPLLRGQSFARDLGGRCVSISGARGGVGTSTIAAALAWLSGNGMHRHTLLLDADLHRGMAGYLLDVESGTGLRLALETPARIDVLLAERAARPATDRLHVLGEQIPFVEDLHYAEGGVAALFDVLRHRYNFIVADMPMCSSVMTRDIAQRVHQRVIVMEPDLVSVRDVLRLLELPAGPLQTTRPILVLNRLGRPGALTRKQIEDALKTSVDLVIPDLPRQVAHAATMGDLPAMMKGAFRHAIIDLAKRVDTAAAIDANLLSGHERGPVVGWWRRIRNKGTSA